MKNGTSAALAAGLVVFLAASSPSFGQDAVLPCDELAADPFDPNRKSDGVALDQVQARQAVPRCYEAISQFRDSGRLWFQYGRALQRQGMPFEAMDAYRSAQRLKHPGGANNLAEILHQGLLRRQKDVKEAEILFRESAAAGYPPAAFQLASILSQRPGYSLDEVKRLLEIAIAADFPDSKRLLASVVQKEPERDLQKEAELAKLEQPGGRLRAIEERERAAAKAKEEEHQRTVQQAHLQRVKEVEAFQAAQRAEAEKRALIRREREAKERAEREAAMRAEAERRERVRQNEAKERAILGLKDEPTNQGRKQNAGLTISSADLAARPDPYQNSRDPGIISARATCMNIEMMFINYVFPALDNGMPPGTARDFFDFLLPRDMWAYSFAVTLVASANEEREAITATLRQGVFLAFCMKGAPR